MAVEVGLVDGVDTFLRELGDDGLRLPGAARERARFGHRGEVFVR
jgi:hypothetical protein